MIIALAVEYNSAIDFGGLPDPIALFILVDLPRFRGGVSVLDEAN
jgi:hypothetical protein